MTVEKKLVFFHFSVFSFFSAHTRVERKKTRDQTHFLFTILKTMITMKTKILYDLACCIADVLKQGVEPEICKRDGIVDVSIIDPGSNNRVVVTRQPGGIPKITVPWPHPLPETDCDDEQPRCNSALADEGRPLQEVAIEKALESTNL